MPKYINIESGHIFYNKNSIPLSNQKILGIKSLTKHNQEIGRKKLAKIINQNQRNQFVLKNKKTNKMITMKDIFKMGEM